MNLGKVPFGAPAAHAKNEKTKNTGTRTEIVHPLHD